jgi:hypothetical protein
MARFLLLIYLYLDLYCHVPVPVLKTLSYLDPEL